MKMKREQKRQGRQDLAFDRIVSETGFVQQLLRIWSRSY